MKCNQSACITQMYHARLGVITPQMESVAQVEKIDPEFLRDEIAGGRVIIPANINHTSLTPMGIGKCLKTKINANIGNSAVTSEIDNELKKLELALKYGSDTVLDLSTGGALNKIREE